MKNNKGFVGVIIAIIAALIIGGGAVYFATRTSTPSSQNTEENNYEPQVDQNVSLSKSISIVSPVSGQQLVQGSTQVIKWSGPSSIAKVDISASPIPDCKEAPCGSNPSETIAIGIPNTGIFNWAVPTNWIGKWTISIGDSNMRVSGVNVGSAEVNVVAPSSSDKVGSIEGYITSDQVGLFHIGEPVPDQTSLSQAKYSIRETTIFPEGNAEKQLIVSKNGKDLLNFEMMFLNQGKIGSIQVISSEFKTKEGVGVGSTISDFIKAYPNYKFWYSEEEGEHFVLFTSNSEEIPQFLLDRSGLINPDVNFNSPIHRQAKISDFKTSAKIASIRVY